MIFNFLNPGMIKGFGISLIFPSLLRSMGKGTGSFVVELRSVVGMVVVNGPASLGELSTMMLYSSLPSAPISFLIVFQPLIEKLARNLYRKYVIFYFNRHYRKEPCFKALITDVILNDFKAILPNLDVILFHEAFRNFNSSVFCNTYPPTNQLIGSLRNH